MQDVYQKMLTRNVTNYNETDEAISTTWVFLAACIPDSCLPSDFLANMDWTNHVKPKITTRSLMLLI